MHTTTFQSPYFKGIWPVLVTPFDEDLNIDISAYRQIIHWHLNFPIGGVYANCLSSEMYELSHEEKLLLVKEAVTTVAGKIPIAATGNFGDSVAEHIDFCQQVAAAGANVVMLTIPTFLEEEEALEAYFMEMAAKTKMPLGIYECPYPRHYNLSLGLIEKLAATGRYLAYKETSCNIDKIRRIIEITRDTPLALLQANIPHLLEATKAGAEGSMNIVANWLPDLAVEVSRRGINGDPSAEELNGILCAMEMAQRSIHPCGVKYLMNKRGLPIEARTRYNKSLSQEEIRSLDTIAKLWFEKDGSLKVLNQMKTEG